MKSHERLDEWLNREGGYATLEEMIVHNHYPRQWATREIEALISWVFEKEPSYRVWKSYFVRNLRKNWRKLSDHQREEIKRAEQPAQRNYDRPPPT